MNDSERNNIVAYRINKAKETFNEMTLIIKNHFLVKVVLGTLIIFTSCVTKTLTSSVDVSELSDIAYFKPISYIRHIEKGNKPVINDSLSKITSDIIESIILLNKNTLRVNTEIVVTDSLLNKKLEQEINFLIQSVLKNKKLEGIKLTPIIDSLMTSNKQRFAMSIITSGFGRRKGNYGGQIAKGIGIGVLTLGMYAPVPIKSNVSIYGLIFDSKNDEITFYKNTMPIEKSPTDNIILTKQFYKLFDGYLYQL